MNVLGILSILAAALMGYVVGVVVTAWGLKSANEGGRIVFIDQDRIKDYLLIIGILNEGLETRIVYQDNELRLGSIKVPLDFLKGVANCPLGHYRTRRTTSES